MNVFAQNACEYADRGLAAFPVDTRHKRPAVKGWQKATPGDARKWARSPKFGASDGLGIVMGQQSWVTEVDVDAVGEAWLAAAMQRFGETPISISTASGKSKLWYRHNGEPRKIRPFNGLPIDILGAGFTIAPPSWREDLGASYAFRTGSLSDIANLPTIPTGAFDVGTFQAAEGVQAGQRNQSLWRWCMAQARYCDDVAALVDAAATWVSAFPDPLSAGEIERCAKSAWSYQSTGRNYLGLKKPQLSEGDFIMDNLIEYPEAFALHQLFQRWHGNRSSFAIAPRAMSEAQSPPWPRRRIEQARDILVERGYLEEISAPTKSKRKAGLYRLASPEGAGKRVYYDCAQIREVREVTR
ncbi:MAG: bifunctional DNA primase/polymerase [Roseovarius sp.]